MALGDEIGVPLAVVRVWAPGQARPTVGARECGRYDILLHSAGVGQQQIGTWSRTNGRSDLEYYNWDGKYGALVSRGELVRQDLQLSQVTTSGGTWESRKPAGGDAKSRIVQLDTTADLTYSARVNNAFPANPNFAVSVFLADAPPDENLTTSPSFFRIEFGASASPWGLEWSKLYGGRLLQYDAASASWLPLRDLPELDRAGNRDNAESLIYVRTMRGQLLVSTDAGESYTAYPGLVPSGRLTFRGQGGMAVLGLHQLLLRSGSWTAPADNAFSTSFGALFFTGSRYDQTGGSVTLTDLSSPANSRIQYRVGITATAGPSPLGWAFYTCGEAYAVRAYSAATPNIRSNGGVSDTAYTGAVEVVEVEKSEELETETADFTIRLDPDTDFSWQRGRLPTVAIDLGDSLRGLTRVFTGVIDLANTETSRYRDNKASFTCYPISYLLRLAKFCKQESCLPYTGYTLNQMADLVLASECIPLNTAFRSWHPLGDSVILGGTDSPEDPFAWPRDGESKWEFLKRMFSLAGLDIATDDSGVIFTLPAGYVAPAVSKTYESVPATDLTNLVMALRWSTQGSESRTAIVVEGEDATGATLVAVAVDDAAEQQPLSERFTPVRLLENERLDGTCGPGMLVLRAQALADSGFRNQTGVTITAPVDLLRNRRDLVTITGFSRVGISPDTLRFAVATLHHSYKADSSMATCTTEAGLRLRP